MNNPLARMAAVARLADEHDIVIAFILSPQQAWTVAAVLDGAVGANVASGKLEKITSLLVMDKIKNGSAALFGCRIVLVDE